MIPDAAVAARPFDAVVFDLFGTLVDEWTVERRDRGFAGMAEALGVPVEGFTRAWRETATHRLTGGFATIEENVADVCRRLGVDPGAERVVRAVRRRIEQMRELLTPRPEARPAIEALRRAGHRIGLLSVCSPEVPSLWRRTEVAPLIQATVFSSEVGLVKPDPGLYALVAGVLDVVPERCLYIGDGSFGELTGAAAAGMTPVLIRAPHEDGQVIERVGDDVDWVGPGIDFLGEVVRVAAELSPPGTP